MNQEHHMRFIQYAYTTDKFNMIFENAIDKVISQLLPIQYEYHLESIGHNESLLHQYPFIENVFIPKLKKTISDHCAFIELEALNIKSKQEKYIQGSTASSSSIAKTSIITLNEKSFELIRRRILLMFLIDLIDESSKILDTNSNSHTNSDIINLSSFISYYTDKDQYHFTINFSFENFLILLNSNNTDTTNTNSNNSHKVNQLEFWFMFYITTLLNEITIDRVEYEFFLCDITQMLSDQFKWQMINIFSEYIAFIQLFLKKTIKCKIKGTSNNVSIIVTMTNNLLWIEEITERLNDNTDTSSNTLLFYIKALKCNPNSKISLMSKLNQCILFDHLILNFYGKCSTMKWKEFVSLCLKENTIKILLINLFEFNHFEYLKLIKLDQELMLSIEQNAIELFTNLCLLIKDIRLNNAIKVIGVQIKKFTSYKAYLTSIINKFNEMIRTIIDTKITFLIYFSNIIEELSSFNAYDGYNRYITRSLSQSDLTFSNPNLFLDCLTCISKANKASGSSKRYYLSLFEKDIKIMHNKTIDYYYFRNYNTNMISNLTLGYFESLTPLITFLSKIPLQAMTQLTKCKFYLKTNKGFMHNNVSALFSLHWPKRSLRSIRFIYESHSAYYNFDVYTLYKDILVNKYFTQEALVSSISSVSPLIKGQSDLSLLHPLLNNEPSFISQYMIQGNHSLLMDTSQIKSIDHNGNGNSYDFNSKYSYLYPLQLVAFLQIETYLQYKLNTHTINYIANTTTTKDNRAYEKSLEKRKLKDKLLNSVVISEYNDVNANITLLFALCKYDKKNKTKVMNALLAKQVMNHFQSEIRIIQLVFKYMKKRRCIFNDFPNSNKVFKKYSHIIGKGFD